MQILKVKIIEYMHNVMPIMVFTSAGESAANKPKVDDNNQRQSPILLSNGMLMNIFTIHQFK